MRTQKQIVLDLLMHRGATGVSAREAIYDLRITRLAAIIYDLKKEGYVIRAEQKPGETARYFIEATRKAPPPRCTCGHRVQEHVARMRCMDYSCPCGAYLAAR